MSAGLALANLLIQVVLMVTALGGLFLAKTRRFRRHCLTMRVAVAVQILAIAFVMAPSLASYVGSWGGWSWLMAEIVVHHVLGLVVLALWIYFNLALSGVVKAPRRMRPFMRSALVVWVISLAMGIHLYVYLWR
jgi:hypothetical protein